MIIVISQIKVYINKKNKIANMNHRSFEMCYKPCDNSNIKIIHFIITRFIIDIKDKFGKITKYSDDYIRNGIRVLKKYLLPSLQNQSCKNFIWILMVGNNVNISDIQTLLNFEISIKYSILRQKHLKNYIRKISKSFDILITTRIDYDDRIYYDAVNDVRKQVNINKPMFLYGYNRGLYFFEFNGKYYDYYRKDNKKGVMSVFISLISVLNKVNDIYTIYDLGDHRFVRINLINKYKLFGIKELNYEPTYFDSGDIKFVFVRQKYSGSLFLNSNIFKSLKENKLNLKKFYGK